MKVTRPSVILEFISMELSETWRFPLPELFSFLYVLFPLFFSYLVRSIVMGPPEAKLVFVASLAEGTVSLITILLILKNISYGLANELKGGLIQTYLSYPVGRVALLSVKVFSGILIPLAYVVFSTLTFAYVNLPGLVTKYFNVLALSLLSLIGQLMLAAGLLLLISILVKGGGASLGLGIASLFGLDALSMAFNMLGGTTGEEVYWHAYYLLNPLDALVNHYGSLRFLYVGYGRGFKPSLNQCLTYLSLHYLIVSLIYLASFAYFARRFEP